MMHHNYSRLYDKDIMLGTYENNIEIRYPDHTFVPCYENNDFSITEDSEVFANGFERVPLEEIDRIVND